MTTSKDWKPGDEDMSPAHVFPEHFDRVSWSCIHFADTVSGTLLQDLNERNIKTFLVDAASCSTERQLLRVIGTALNFPDYFGENWDALDECLRDMSWHPANGYLVIVRNSAELWREHLTTAGKLVESWLFAAEDWSQRRRPFHLAFTA